MCLGEPIIGVCRACAGRCGDCENGDARIPFGAIKMRTTYYDDDDILVIHLSDKPITREVSQDWNTHISYAADGSAVEVVVLDAKANGALPVEVLHGQAA
jgi:hypothetical protein